MRLALNRVPAIALLASLALLVQEAGAATILIFGQTSNTDVVTETISGSTVTLTTGPLGIPISITNIGGLTPPGGSLAGFETFTLTSTTGPGGSFSGTIVISPLPGGAGTPPGLTAAVTGGLLTVSGNTASFLSPTTTFSNLNPAIIAQIGLTNPPGSTSLSFNNLTFTSTGFTAQNSGLFAAVPEPASIVSGCIAVLAGLGCFGARPFMASAA
jgi:hypothetical protein